MALKCLAQGHSDEKTRGSSATPTREPTGYSHTIYH